jgi:bacterioferritin-associated ferredoxin
VQQAGRSGVINGAELIATFGLKESGCCGRCAKNIHELVALASGQLAQT